MKSILLLLVSLDFASVAGAITPSVSNVTYCSPDGVPQLLDIYNPTSGNRGPWPIVVNIHGGGWIAGDKALYGFSDSVASGLVAAGWAVASINYRLAPTYQFPAQIEDAKCAVRFLRANASTYNLDPNHFLTMGESAGAHLGMLVAVAGPSAGWDVGEWLGVPSSVNGVLSAWGPADLSRPDFIALQLLLLEEVFGTDDPQALLRVSPVYYLTSSAPPFMVVHGELDAVVPVDQAVELNEGATDLGVQIATTLVANAGHELAQVYADKPIYPTLPDVVNQTVEFLTSH